VIVWGHDDRFEPALGRVAVCCENDRADFDVVPRCRLMDFSIFDGGRAAKLEQLGWKDQR
jgi:hypothetical protein